MDTQAEAGAPGGKRTEERLLTVSDVADYLSVPVSTVYRAVRPRSQHATPIPHFKLCGRLRFAKDEVYRWAMSHRRGDA